MKSLLQNSDINWRKLGKLLGHSGISQFSCSVKSNSLQPHGLQHAKLPCQLPTAKAHTNSCSSCQWCHPTISASVLPLSCLQSFPTSESFEMSQLFTPGGKVLEFHLQHQSFQWKFRTASFRMDWLDLLAVKGLSRVFWNATVQKHQKMGQRTKQTFLQGRHIDG